MEKQYHEALEIRDRVRVELLKQTILGLRIIAVKLADFKWWSLQQGQLSLARVHRASGLLVNVLVQDVEELSSSFDKYDVAYRKKRFRATDDAFVSVASELISSLEILYLKLKQHTNLDLDEEFTEAWLQGNATFTPSRGAPWPPWNPNNEKIVDVANMRKVQHAAEAIKKGSDRAESGLPDTWHPGADWTNLCFRSLNNLVDLLDSSFYESLEMAKNMSNHDDFYSVFKLLMDLEKAKECRLLYRNSFTKTRDTLEEIKIDAEEFLQVGSIRTFGFFLSCKNLNM